jgi:hypothetical protein
MVVISQAVQNLKFPDRRNAVYRNHRLQKPGNELHVVKVAFDSNWSASQFDDPFRLVRRDFEQFNH